MNTLVSHALPTLLGLLIKSTVLLLVAWTACSLLRRASAATRHLIWAAALVAVLLLPILSLSLPRWNVAVTHPVTVSPAKPPLAAVPILSADAPLGGVDKTPALPPAPTFEQTTQGNELKSAAAATLPPKTKRSYSTLLVCAAVAFGAWFVGFILIIAQFSVGLRQIERIRKQGLPLSGAVLGIAQDVQKRFGIRLVAFLRASDKSGVVVPVTWGLFQPTVLLPAQSVSWSEECLQAALLHEIAHIQRWDWLTQMVTRLACALYWWHPLVWFAAKQARAESERACDDLVLGTGMRAADYAQRLVEVVRSMPAGTTARSVAIAMAQPSEVEGRLRAVLAKGRNRRPLTQRLTASVVCFCLVMALPLAAIHPVARAQANQTEGSLSTAPAQRQMPRGILEFVYLKDVRTDAFPGRPLTMEAVGSADGHPSYQLVDIRTGQRSRDPKTVQAEFQKLMAQGYTQRAGATAYLIPLRLSIEVPTREVFFTPAQRNQAESLDREKKAFLDLLEDSPVIITDAEVSSAKAIMSEQVPPVPALDVVFTPDGARKLKAFTTSHKGETMGILVNGGLISAPRIIDEFSREGVISGSFHDLAEAKALAQVLNQPTGSEQITPTSYRGTWPDGTQIILNGGAADTAPTATGYEATLANGYTVGVAEVTQAVAVGNEWNMYSGPWWEPGGTTLADPLEKPDEGLWHWSIHQHGGSAPFIFKFTLTPRQTAATSPGQEISTYEEFIGTDNRTQLVDSLPFTRNEGAFGGATIPAYFAPGTRTCSIRCGVAAGPWRKAATLPAHLTPPTGGASAMALPNDGSAVEIKLDDKPALMYQAADGTRHTDYFLGHGHLGNVARRVVAIDNAGHTIPLQVTGSGMCGLSLISLGFNRGSSLASFNHSVKLAEVKEFRLETRPYQIVEFRNVQLQPRARGNAVIDAASTQAWQTKEEADLYNMRRISLLILEYTQDNNGKLPSLRNVALLAKDLDPYQKQGEKYPDPTTHQPYRIQGKALFISPLTSQPYRFATSLSNTLIAKISSPASVVLAKDGPITKPDGTHWLVEMFADGHVKSRNIP